MIKTIFLLGVGVFGGLWIAWPGISLKDNWECALDVVTKSRDEKTELRALMTVSPKFLLRKKSSGPLEKLRFVGDVCFR
tara:strand:+ start:1963 stop:2199 length:237 start_codon:yes stop_codon:yes gene_type:complete